MKREIGFYISVMNNGIEKGQLNTLRKKFKYIFRNILYYDSSKKIANFIISHKYLKKEVYRYPVLCSKIHRPYGANEFDIDKKIKIITSSYKFLDNYFKDETLDKLYSDGEILVCDIEAKNKERYSVKLKLYTDFEKEGEFNLICYNSQDKVLAKLTFAFDGNDVYIGGLQGLEKEDEITLIKEATKDLYGIFPKKLLIEILYYLFPENKKIAVGNTNHIYLAMRYRYKKQRTINANYDEFWESFSSKKEGEFWILPDKLERKNIEDIPSKKRSLYNNRFRLLDSIEKTIKDFKNENGRKNTKTV